MGAEKEMQPEFLSTLTIARIVDRSDDAIRKEITSGKLKAFKFGNRYAVRLVDYEEWKSKYFKPVL